MDDYQTLELLLSRAASRGRSGNDYSLYRTFVPDGSSYRLTLQQPLREFTGTTAGEAFDQAIDFLQHLTQDISDA